MYYQHSIKKSLTSNSYYLQQIYVTPGILKLPLISQKSCTIESYILRCLTQYYCSLLVYNKIACFSNKNNVNTIIMIEALAFLKAEGSFSASFSNILMQYS